MHQTAEPASTLTSTRRLIRDADNDHPTSAVLAVNGQIPGPTITADWGDTLVINVKNSMQHNGQVAR